MNCDPVLYSETDFPGVPKRLVLDETGTMPIKMPFALGWDNSASRCRGKTSKWVGGRIFEAKARGTTPSGSHLTAPIEASVQTIVLAR